MRTYALHEARAAFSKVIDRALAGEPQRVTRHGRDAVVIVSEEEWAKRAGEAPKTLVDLFLKYAGDEGYDDVFGGERPWSEHRVLGADFLSDED